MKTSTTISQVPAVYVHWDLLKEEAFVRLSDRMICGMARPTSISQVLFIVISDHMT